MIDLTAWWHSIGSRRNRSILLIVLVAGAALRVTWVSYAGVEPSFGSDTQAYLLLGKQLARGDGYQNPLIEPANKIRAQQHLAPLPREPSAFYPPGYPTFIAAVAWTVWHSPIPDHALVRTIGYVQALLGVLSILMVFVLARRVFGTGVGLTAAALMALYPNLIALTATLQFETVFIALTLATVLLLYPIAVDEQPKMRRLVAGGVMTGVVALLHPPIAFILIALVATRMLSRRKFRQTLQVALALGFTMVLAMSPWIIRNAVELHAFIPTATGAGPALCQSRNVEATGKLDTGILVRQCGPHSSEATSAASDVATNSYATRSAIRWVIHNPLQELRMWFWRTQLAYQEDTTGLSTIRPHMDARWYDAAAALSTGSSFVVLGFATIGAAIILRKKRSEDMFLLGCTIAYAAVPIILFGDPRYRVPAEPFFVILAAAGIFTAYNGVKCQPVLAQHDEIS